MNKNKLTPQAQEALSVAQTRAVHWHHVVIDVEHLLMALLEQQGSLVPRLQAAMDVPLDDMLVELEKGLKGRPCISETDGWLGRSCQSQRLTRILTK